MLSLSSLDNLLSDEYMGLFLKKVFTLSRQSAKHANFWFNTGSEVQCISHLNRYLPFKLGSSLNHAVYGQCLMTIKAMITRPIVT